MHLTFKIKGSIPDNLNGSTAFFLSKKKKETFCQFEFVVFPATFERNHPFRQRKPLLGASIQTTTTITYNSAAKLKIQG